MARKNSFEPPPFKRMKMENAEDELLEIMKPPVSGDQRGERKKYCIAPQKTYLEACKEMKETGISFRKAAEKYKRSRQIFSVEQEEELAVFVRETSDFYNGMSSKDVRILAFVYGVCNQVDLPVGWRESHQASFDWCLGFIKRNKLTPMMTSSHQFRNTGNGNVNGAASKEKAMNDEKTEDIPKAAVC
ncbi:hypothetical protein Bhyg_11669 [Pseudolycoriella hygida]|uniref:HTH CENPB-type domain-containing protein n=1 Tax=Pseudolycoriella hygida TaxID=35572 RepID=A0A9Q0MVZ8_9DIPT|nr:hypothetical protein Bhyg_11669 [Pseudolycoriella hygida]